MLSALRGTIIWVAGAAGGDYGASGAKGYPLALPLNSGNICYSYKLKFSVRPVVSKTVMQ